jgi:starch synthase
MVAAENDNLPKGKVGGIGDVIRDVPYELAKLGHKVSVITPSYGYQSTQANATLLFDFEVDFAGKTEQVQLFQIQDDRSELLTQYVLEHPLFSIGGIGKIYCDDEDNRPFARDASKFALFCTAIATLVQNQWLQVFNVIHMHDWHAALLAVLREYSPEFTALKSLRFVYTIHNLALQGIRPFANDESSFAHWFPELSVDHTLTADPRYPECFNPTRAAINLADAVHVVSPTYAKEVVKPSNESLGFIGGEGLELDLQRVANQQKLFGILNGCEYEQVHSISIDISTLFTQISTQLMQWAAQQREMLSSHYIAMQHLNSWQQVDNQTGPLVTSIGRLTAQKVALLLSPYAGTTVLDQLLTVLANYNGRLLILGSGDVSLENRICQVMARHENLLFLNGYGEQLSNSIYDLGDLFLMPSSFEPCGISQLLAMRAGQPCVVHKIGGLADTVEHLKTGFCFSGNNVAEQSQQLVEVFELALKTFKSKTKWKKLVNAAKKQRFKWQSSIEQYIAHLYSTK